MTEQDAIQRCLRNKDPLGFEFLVQQYKREAYYHAYALLKNEADAADACQDAFVKAFAAMPRLTQLDSFYPWFYRILRNRCLNLIDRQKTRQRHQTTEQARATGVNTVTPADNLTRKEASSEVWQTLCKLDRSSRAILTLKYIHEFSYEQISATLGIPRGTVMSRLYRARKQFKAQHPHDQDSQPKERP